MLKISIIWAAYNEWENIQHFLHYWVSQKYSNKEIIVVDDWSRDNTCEIVERRQLTYPNVIRLVRHSVNQWVWWARLTWFIHSTWDVVKFSDTDVAPDHPIQDDLLDRLMLPFNNNNLVDVVYIKYQPYFDEDNIIRSLENFYYYSPVLNAPVNYALLKEPSSHMPTLFRKKALDLSWVKSIKNWEDRYIAKIFLENSVEAALAEWNIILDVNNKDITELLVRYFKYWKNAKWLLKTSFKTFVVAVIKPLIVLFSLILCLIGLMFGWTLLVIPLLWIYSFLFLLTLFYVMNYRKYFVLKLYILLVGPFFILLRYLSMAVWLIRVFLWQ